MRKPLNSKRFAALLVGGSLLASLCCSCALLPVEEEAPNPPVIHAYESETYKFASVQRGDVVEAMRISCSYTPAKKQELAFEEGGVILSAIYVMQGDQVEEGEVLAELDREALLVEIENCRYELDVLRLQREHMSEDADFTARAFDIRLNAAKKAGNTALYDQLASQKKNAADDAAAQINIQTARVDAMQNKLDELERTAEARVMRAPFSGTVTAIKTSGIGLPSVAGDDIITVSDKSTSVFTASGKNADYFEIGDEVEITVSSTVYTAKVVDPKTMGVEVDESKRYIVLDEYVPDIKENTTGSVTIVIEERSDVLWVTAGAVKSADGKSFVYYLDENNIKNVKYFESGFTAAGRVEVLSGLELGEQVIVQ